MGLAASQIQLLTLTARKADCEFGITMDSMQKMTLTREMSQLTSEYNRRLQSKNLVFYNNGSYNPINYNYLMGPQGYLTGGNPVKDDYSMVLTDYNGRVVLNNDYSSAILKVLGNGVMDHTGRGQTFSQDKIPEILAQLLHISGDAESELDIIQTIVDGKELEDYSNTYNVQNSMTGENIGDIIEKNSNLTEKYKALIDFYYPIFVAAANNGWTCEYNNSMSEGNKDYNSNYVSDALISGTFQIMSVDNNGNYDIDTSLTYFITADKVEERSDSEDREELTAWFEAEKARITEKELLIDLHLDDLSTELEAIKQEIQSIETFIDDAVKSVFDWGSG